jgi:hypothetical protein
MTTRPVLLDDAATLQETAAAIAHSVLYVGASLHGYVTAAAYGVPGVIVTSAPMRKFGGFLRWLGRPEDLATDVGLGLDRARRHLDGGGAVAVPAGVRHALDGHWQRILAALDAPGARRAQRQAMLRRLTARAIAADGGWDWAMQPWTGFGTPRRADASPPPGA